MSFEYNDHYIFSKLHRDLEVDTHLNAHGNSLFPATTAPASAHSPESTSTHSNCSSPLNDANMPVPIVPDFLQTVPPSGCMPGAKRQRLSSPSTSSPYMTALDGNFGMVGFPPSTTPTATSFPQLVYDPSGRQQVMSYDVGRSPISAGFPDTTLDMSSYPALPQGQQQQHQFGGHMYSGTGQAPISSLCQRPAPHRRHPHHRQRSNSPSIHHHIPTTSAPRSLPLSAAGSDTLAPDALLDIHCTPTTNGMWNTALRSFATDPSIPTDIMTPTDTIPTSMSGLMDIYPHHHDTGLGITDPAMFMGSNFAAARSNTSSASPPCSVSSLPGRTSGGGGRTSLKMGLPIPSQESMMSQFSTRRCARPAKKYVCETCGKGFGRPSSLKTHYNSHTGQRPHACTIEGCDKSFTVSSNRKRHEKTHFKNGVRRKPIVSSTSGIQQQSLPVENMRCGDDFLVSIDDDDEEVEDKEMDEEEEEEEEGSSPGSLYED